MAYVGDMVQANNPSGEYTPNGPLNNYGNSPATATQALSQQAPENLEAYNWNMYQQTGDKSYLDNFMDLRSNRQNTSAAQQWYNEMSSSQYQRAVEDLKKAGLNPYLALQGLSGAGAGSVSAAQGTNSSARSNEINQQKANADVTKTALGALASLAMMLIMLA